MDGHYTNAMTEIALALAMAFFSLMVLTLVSMGAGGAGQAADAAALETVTASVRPAAPPESAVAKDQVTSDDVLIIFAGGEYLDRDLAPVDPTTLGGAARVILAIAPDTPLTDALEARGRIPSANLVISTLDGRWQEALKARP